MPGNYGSNKKPKMTYQQYVKARSQHMKQQGTTLKGTERMKQIANEWNGKGKGIAMAGGGFSDIIKGVQSFLGQPRMSGGQLKEDEMEMVGGGAKLNKLKKLALKFGVPLASAAALMALGSQDMREPDVRNNMPFEMIDDVQNTPDMDDNEITGMGLKKKGKKQMGKGVVNKIGQIAKKFGIPLVTAVAILSAGLVAENETEILLSNAMMGKGTKLNKFKKLAKKYAIPVATVLGVLVAGRNLDLKNIAKMAGDFVSGNKKRIVSVSDMTGFSGDGVKKRTKYPHNMVKGNMLKVAKSKKEHDKLSKMGYNHPMQGEGFFSDIGDSISGFFSDPVSAIEKTAGLTLSALPFIL